MHRSASLTFLIPKEEGLLCWVWPLEGGVVIMIHATGQVGRPSLCHCHILDNWELALGSWETDTIRKADCGQLCTKSGLREKKRFGIRWVSEQHCISLHHHEGASIWRSLKSMEILIKPKHWCSGSITECASLENCSKYCFKSLFLMIYGM